MTAAAKHTLRAIARRWLALSEEITEHETLLIRAEALMRGRWVEVSLRMEVLTLPIRKTSTCLTGSLNRPSHPSYTLNCEEPV